MFILEADGTPNLMVAFDTSNNEIAVLFAPPGGLHCLASVDPHGELDAILELESNPEMSRDVLEYHCRHGSGHNSSSRWQSNLRSPLGTASMRVVRSVEEGTCRVHLRGFARTMAHGSSSGSKSGSGVRGVAILFSGKSSRVSNVLLQHPPSAGSRQVVYPLLMMGIFFYLSSLQGYFRRMGILREHLRCFLIPRPHLAVLIEHVSCYNTESHSNIYSTEVLERV
ncbi:hypothetical protein K402DRAFT_27229 [Aulographum hederae CBS 113979]|uniref:Uncharacterized protein n=1 Tax=Aulographum hederae CBS 113979 TaxID=1176131 RepID=A0A6G1H611_9PEZI|nr:hypothetical protein K402DRAFT_27229 [Aulographum hederae CBS 113979]